MNKSLELKRLLNYTLIAALAVVFIVEWGPGSRGCGKAQKVDPQDAVATVNGKEITQQRYAKVYSNQLARFRSQGLTAELARQFGIPHQVLDQLVTQELMIQAAEARGITPSDAELLEFLKKMPEFQKDGHFDPEQYKDTVRDYYRETDVAFENELRRELSVEKMVALVNATATLSDDEVRAHYEKDGNKAKVTFVRFSPTLFANQVGTPKVADIDAFIKSHDKEMHDFYTANQMSYHLPEKVKARQIVIRLAPDATDDQKKAAKDKIEALRKDAAGGKDFGELAKASSDDAETKDKGGELGFVDRLALPPAVANAVFGLTKPNDLTEPVETKLGYYLLQLEEKQAAEAKSFEQVKPEIASQLFIKEKARGIAKAEADKALKEANGGKTLAELYPPTAADGEQPNFRFAQQTKPEATQSGDFAKNAPAIPQLGTAPTAQAAIFATTEPKLLDQVFEVGDSFAIIHVDERKTSSDADFAANKDKLRSEAEQAKKIELEEGFKKALRQNANIVTNERAVEQIAGG